jgi:lysophospholipase L1-like esterase
MPELDLCPLSLGEILDRAFTNDAWSAAQGITALINEIRKSPIEPGMPVPPVLVICPPQIRSPRGNIAPKFRDAEQRCAGLAEAYMQVASGLGCHFFNASTVTTSSRVDGVHLDRDQHSKLGNALAEVVRLILHLPRTAATWPIRVESQ